MTKKRKSKVEGRRSKVGEEEEEEEEEKKC
jgi:hypothetical protein